MENLQIKNVTKKIKKLYDEYVEQFIILMILVAILAGYLWFSTYTNEISLTCSKQNNLCTITHTNLYGHKQYKSFELSSAVRAEHHIRSINRYKRTLAAISRPFSAAHEFVILQKDNKSIKVYSVESSGMSNLSDISGMSNLFDIEDINNNVLRFNNFIDNNKIEQVTIEKF